MKCSHSCVHFRELDGIVFNYDIDIQICLYENLSDEERQKILREKLEIISKEECFTKNLIKMCKRKPYKCILLLKIFGKYFKIKHCNILLNFLKKIKQEIISKRHNKSAYIELSWIDFPKQINLLKNIKDKRIKRIKTMKKCVEILLEKSNNEKHLNKLIFKYIFKDKYKN